MPPVAHLERSVGAIAGAVGGGDGIVVVAPVEGVASGGVMAGSEDARGGVNITSDGAGFQTLDYERSSARFARPAANVEVVTAFVNSARAEGVQIVGVGIAAACTAFRLVSVGNTVPRRLVVIVEADVLVSLVASSVDFGVLHATGQI